MSMYSVVIHWKNHDFVQNYTFLDVEILFDFVEWICNYYDVEITDVMKEEIK